MTVAEQLGKLCKCVAGAVVVLLLAAMIYRYTAYSQREADTQDNKEGGKMFSNLMLNAEERSRAMEHAHVYRELEEVHPAGIAIRFSSKLASRTL